MGSTDSRPRLRKVAPCNSLQENGDESKPQWTLPALPLTTEQESGSLRQKKKTLPPLKQEITLSSLSEPTSTGTFPPKQSNNSSIILSHPPRRPQALQPLAFQIGHTRTANQIAMGRNHRDGDVHQLFTTGETGTSRMIQEGFLEAQISLGQQTRLRRQTHLRQARDKRRHKAVYRATVGGPDAEGIQRLMLVRRPTERDIFWDESTGTRLDPNCLLQPKSLFDEERPSNQPNKQLLCTADDASKRDRAHGLKSREEQMFNNVDVKDFLDKDSSQTSERKTVRKVQRDSYR